MKGIWLAILTVREAILKGTLIFYFVVGNVIILLFALAIHSSIEGGVLTMTVFGQKFAPNAMDASAVLDFVFLQLFQSSTSAIMLFGIFATAGLIPSMLEKGTVELYLSKPISRPHLLIFRSLGACGGIGANMIYFAIGIWFLFGVKLGVWHTGFLAASSIVIFIFFFYYSVVALVSVITRSTGFSIMFAFLFSLFSSALENRERTLFMIWDNPVYHRLLDVLYYVTPQLNRMTQSASAFITTNPVPGMGGSSLEFSILPFVYSALSASLFYAAAAWYFSRQDY